MGCEARRSRIPASHSGVWRLRVVVLSATHMASRRVGRFQLQKLGQALSWAQRFTSLDQWEGMAIHQAWPDPASCHTATPHRLGVQPTRATTKTLLTPRASFPAPSELVALENRRPLAPQGDGARHKQDYDVAPSCATFSRTALGAPHFSSYSPLNPNTRVRRCRCETQGHPSSVAPRTSLETSCLPDKVLGSCREERNSGALRPEYDMA